MLSDRQFYLVLFFSGLLIFCFAALLWRELSLDIIVGCASSTASDSIRYKTRHENERGRVVSIQFTRRKAYCITYNSTCKHWEKMNYVRCFVVMTRVCVGWVGGRESWGGGMLIFDKLHDNSDITSWLGV